MSTTGSTAIVPLLAQAAGQAGTTPAASGDPDLLLWGVILLAFAVLLMVVEAFLPTGGIVGLMAAVAAIGGLVCLTLENTTLGLLASIAAVIAFPVAAWYMLKHAPDLPLGRLMTLENEEPRGRPERAEADSTRPLIGEEGTAESALRPMGACRFERGVAECVALDAVIDADARVRVVELRDGRPIVEQI